MASAPWSNDGPGLVDNPDDIHQLLRGLRGKEISGQHQPYVPYIPIPFFKTADAYIRLVFVETFRYLKFAWSTWNNLIYQTYLDLFISTRSEVETFGDWFSHAFFAIGSISVLPFVLIFCLIARLPFLSRLYYRWSEFFGGGLGLVNSGNPNLFKELTWRQAEKARIALSKPFDTQKNNEKKRTFDYDISKFLLQLAAVIYEHENDKIREAVNFYTPGELWRRLFGNPEGDRVDASEYNGDVEIHKFCAQFEIEYEPISELNNGSSAFCGLFWDPKSNWIVVAFKGTGPIEFGEWLSDLDATMVPLGRSEDGEDYITGFNRVHKGFKDRVFPDYKNRRASAHQRPYNTISIGVRALATKLIQTAGLPQGTKINIWLTGHSLISLGVQYGCATASLVYGRFLMNEWELGSDADLRDAYLYAAPIICDPESVRAFNKKMFEDAERPKTMWRVTSNDDIVATALPQRGDLKVNPKLKPGQPYPRTNNFDFAHLGTEIVLYDFPHSSDVRGNHVVHGAEIKIKSDFPLKEIIAQRDKRRANWAARVRETTGILLQKIPAIGRGIAHCTIYYWDQLDRAALSECDWVAI